MVAGVYDKCAFFPKKFKWTHQEYPIDRITLIANVKDGSIKKRLYTVMSGPNLYRLEFNRETEKWTLEAIWFD